MFVGNQKRWDILYYNTDKQMIALFLFPVIDSNVI